jgi:hypothetical protein
MKRDEFIVDIKQLITDGDLDMVKKFITERSNNETMKYIHLTTMFYIHVY